MWSLHCKLKKKKEDKKKVSNNRTQNGKKKELRKAGRANTSNLLRWVGMQMNYRTKKKLNLPTKLYSSLCDKQKLKKNLRGKKYGTTNHASMQLEP